MRNLKELNRYRFKQWENKVLGDQEAYGYEDKAGCFLVTSQSRDNTLRIIAGKGRGWEHLSISCSLKDTPTWAEMEQVKRMFFKEDETVMQLHVPTDEHISNHNFTLHLWRPTFKKIPRPPNDMV
jgi:hypothetical protein